MRVLFISYDLLAANLAYRMKQEGHDVKLYISDKGRRNNFTNLVQKTSNWQKELKWVGKDGLIVFDYIGYGATQKRLREWGYSVVGGSFEADRFEDDRKFAQNIFEKYGLTIVPNERFDTIDAAIEFVKKNPDVWVIKQHSHASKGLNYVGKYDDGHDVTSTLENYKRIYPLSELNPIFLQKRIHGVEIGVGRYFNGKDWVGPIEMNIEYKKFFPGNLGPATGEMGTLAWYDDNESNKLFQQALAPLKPYLQKIDFRGDIDINCIVNEEGAFPLEPTPRFGSPIIHLHDELHESSWADFLKALADGKTFDLKWKRGYGIVVVLGSAPLPYTTKIRGVSSHGVNVYFENYTEDEMKHIHFEEISQHDDLSGRSHFYISDDRGYILYVTGVGSSVEEARTKVYGLIDRITIPKIFYRNDIGNSFIETDADRLERWGYITGKST